MVNIILWLIAGAILGGLATLLTHRRRSILLLNIVLGSLGAFVAGYLLLPLLHISTINFSFSGLLVSLGSTFVLLAVVNFFVREHTVANSDMEDQWDLVRRKIRARWSKITEEEVGQIGGNYDQLISLIEERYGIAKVEAEDQLQGFLQAVITKKVSQPS